MNFFNEATKSISAFPNWHVFLSHSTLAQWHRFDNNSESILFYLFCIKSHPKGPQSASYNQWKQKKPRSDPDPRRLASAKKTTPNDISTYINHPFLHPHCICINIISIILITLLGLLKLLIRPKVLNRILLLTISTWNLKSSLYSGPTSLPWFSSLGVLSKSANSVHTFKTIDLLSRHICSSKYVQTFRQWIWTFLSRAQLVPTTLALRTTTYLSEETEYLPWQSAINNLHYYRQMLDRTQVYQPMQVIYAFDLFRTVISWDMQHFLVPLFLKDQVFVLQDYLKKLVTPVFSHFKNLTSNWTEVPTKHTDQWVYSVTVQQKKDKVRFLRIFRVLVS